MGSLADRLAAALEKEELVECLDEERRRLVDRAQDRLAAVCELAEEADEVPRALAIETRGRLVEEEEQLGLRGKPMSAAHTIE